MCVCVCVCMCVCVRERERELRMRSSYTSASPLCLQTHVMGLPSCICVFTVVHTHTRHLRKVQIPATYEKKCGTQIRFQWEFRISPLKEALGMLNHSEIFQ